MSVCWCNYYRSTVVNFGHILTNWLLPFCPCGDKCPHQVIKWMVENICDYMLEVDPLLFSKHVWQILDLRIWYLLHSFAPKVNILEMNNLYDLDHWSFDLEMVHDTSSPHGLYLCYIWSKSVTRFTVLVQKSAFIFSCGKQLYKHSMSVCLSVCLSHFVYALPGAILLGSWWNLVGAHLGLRSRPSSFVGDVAR